MQIISFISFQDNFFDSFFQITLPNISNETGLQSKYRFLPAFLIAVFESHIFCVNCELPYSCLRKVLQQAENSHLSEVPANVRALNTTVNNQETAVLLTANSSLMSMKNTPSVFGIPHAIPFTVNAAKVTTQAQPPFGSFSSNCVPLNVFTASLGMVHTLNCF